MKTTHSKNTIKKAIDYLSIYCNKTERFDDYMHISRAISNPLKISYISAKKIKGLEENTDISISKNPSKDFRDKHFTATSVNKFFKKLFLEDTFETKKKITEVSEDIDNFLRKDVETEFFIEDDISGLYSQTNKDYQYTANGSCMNKSEEEFFEFYYNIYSHSVKVVGLKIGKQIIARALFWYNKEKAEYYLDRIYIADYLNTGNNVERLQSELFLKVKRSFKLKNLNCNQKEYIHRYLKSQNFNDEKLKFETYMPYSYPNFNIKIDSIAFYNFDSYPYLDTFRYGIEKKVKRMVLKKGCKYKKIEKRFAILSFGSCDASGHSIELNCTDGEYNESNRIFCDCCEEGFGEDDGCYYSDVEGENLCEDCGVYCSERDETIREDNAVYNNYTGEYIYRHDIEY